MIEKGVSADLIPTQKSKSNERACGINFQLFLMDLLSGQRKKKIRNTTQTRDNKVRVRAIKSNAAEIK